MLRRIESGSKETALPTKWTDEFKQVLLNLYGDKCLEEDHTFDVHAFSYPEELLLTTTYLPMNGENATVTLFLSLDLNEGQEFNKLLDTLFNSVGVFFDHYFAELESNEDHIFTNYIYDWEETEFSGLKFFHKISRENPKLTIEANKLLAL